MKLYRFDEEAGWQLVSTPQCLEHAIERVEDEGEGEYELHGVAGQLVAGVVCRLDRIEVTIRRAGR